MRKVISLFGMFLAFLFVTPALAQANQPVDVFINYQELKSDQPALLDTAKNRTFLPVRAVAETLGAKVEFVKDGPIGPEVHVVKDGRAIIIPIGSKKTWINDGMANELVMIDAPAFIIPETNRTMLPLRFTGESLGVEVEWRNGAVYIYDDEQPVGVSPEEYIQHNPVPSFMEKAIKKGWNTGNEVVLESNFPLVSPFSGDTIVHGIEIKRNAAVSKRLSREYYQMFVRQKELHFQDGAPNYVRVNVLRTDGTWHGLDIGSCWPDVEIHGDGTVTTRRELGWWPYTTPEMIDKIFFAEVVDGRTITWVYHYQQ